jgi:hypothetical protein
MIAPHHPAPRKKFGHQAKSTAPVSINRYVLPPKSLKKRDAKKFTVAATRMLSSPEVRCYVSKQIVGESLLLPLVVN